MTQITVSGRQHKLGTVSQVTTSVLLVLTDIFFINIVTSPQDHSYISLAVLPIELSLEGVGLTLTVIVTGMAVWTWRHRRQMERSTVRVRLIAAALGLLSSIVAFLL